MLRYVGNLKTTEHLGSETAMALLLLIVIGVSAGWLASIIARTEAPREILRQMAIGLVVSLAAGLLVNAGTIFGGLTPLALGIAIAATAAALVGYNAVFTRRTEG